MKVLPKDFLSIEDVANYLEKFGYSYDLEIQSEYRRLISDIYDLANERKIVAVFHCYGKFQQEINEFEYDEDSSTGEPVRIPIYQEFNNITIGDYFCIQRSLLKEIFVNENKVIVDDYFERYGYSTVTPQGRDISYYLHNSIQISLRDIRIPRCELDSLFQETKLTDSQRNKSDETLIDDNTLDHSNMMGTLIIEQGEAKTNEQIIKEFREDIAQLTVENNDLKNQLGDLSDNNDQLSDRNEKSYQTTIGLLLELMTTPKGVNNKAPFQSQAIIISNIVDKSIYGQRKSSLETRFRDANVILIDAKKK